MFSTQGMEKSHYRARGVYFKNTRHGGGQVRSNYLAEMFNWFFRYTFGRVQNMERANASTIAKKARAEKRSTNAHKWNFSLGPRCHAIWRSTMIQNGRKWVKSIQ